MIIFHRTLAEWLRGEPLGSSRERTRERKHERKPERVPEHGHSHVPERTRERIPSSMRVDLTAGNKAWGDHLMAALLSLSGPGRLRDSGVVDPYRSAPAFDH